MRVLIGAAAASLVFAFAASAQPTAPGPGGAADVGSSRCPNAPTAPTLPDGARASDRAMVSANDALQAWNTALEANAACRAAEINEILGQVRAREQAHEALNARLTEVNARWLAQRTAYCDRRGRQCVNRSEAEALAAAPVQSPPCPETISTPEPVIPEGASASREAMDRAEAEYWTWGPEVKRNLQCRSGEHAHLRAALEARLAAHNGMVQRAGEVATAWETEYTEYCGRRGKTCEATEEELQ